MTTLSWAFFGEGRNDESYFGALIPRLMADLVSTHEVAVPAAIPQQPAFICGKNDRSIAAVAAEICANAESFRLLFLHSDAGGRNLQRSLPARTTAYFQQAAELCDWPSAGAVVVAPIKETEAWALADPSAVRAALGLSMQCAIALPYGGANVEQIGDPKAELDRIVRDATKGRRSHGGSEVLVSIAQNQDFVQLRLCPSFRTFEAGLVMALQSLTVLP